MATASEIFKSMEVGTDIPDEPEITEDVPEDNEELLRLIEQPRVITPNIISLEQSDVPIVLPSTSSGRKKGKPRKSATLSVAPVEYVESDTLTDSMAPPETGVEASTATPKPAVVRKRNPPRKASLEIPKKLAEFTRQAKLIKQAIVEEKQMERTLARLPSNAKPKRTNPKRKKNELPEFSCGICSTIVTSMALLMDHFKKMHGIGKGSKVPKGELKKVNEPEPSGEILTCGFCGKVERTTKSLMLHFVLKHPSSSTNIAPDKRPPSQFFGAGEHCCGLCGMRKFKDVELLDHFRMAHPVGLMKPKDTKATMETEKDSDSSSKGKRKRSKYVVDEPVEKKQTDDFDLEACENASTDIEGGE